MNYKFNLLHRVGVVAKRVCGGGSGDGSRRGRQYPFELNGPRGKNVPLCICVRKCKTLYISIKKISRIFD